MHYKKINFENLLTFIIFTELAILTIHNYMHFHMIYRDYTSPKINIMQIMGYIIFIAKV